MAFGIEGVGQAVAAVVVIEAGAGVVIRGARGSGGSKMALSVVVACSEAAHQQVPTVWVLTALTMAVVVVVVRVLTRAQALARVMA